MNKKIIIIFGCGLIIFLVYLSLDNNNNIKQTNKNKKINDLEQFNQKNNLELPKPTFDPYTFYTKNNKLDQKEDFENDFNLQSQSVPKLSDLKRTSTYLKTEQISIPQISSNFLVPSELESNSIFSMPFPENTSIELGNFTAENVTDLFDADNMGDLYNNINADMYKGYKTLKYML